MRRTAFVLAVLLVLLVPALLPGREAAAAQATPALNAFACDAAGTCVFADVFDPGDGGLILCAGTLDPATGQSLQGCTPLPTGALTYAEDLSSAALAPTPVEVCPIDPTTGEPVEGDCQTVTASATFAATEPATKFSERFRVKEGGCQFRFAAKGVRAHGTATVTVGGTTATTEPGQAHLALQTTSGKGNCQGPPPA